MPNESRELTGNRPKDYKETAAPVKREGEQVRMWRQRISRAAGLLNIGGRAKAVELGDQYIKGLAVTKNAKKIYIAYLKPMLEDMYRRTLPRIPTPRVDAKNDIAEKDEGSIRAILSQDFGSSRAQVKQIAQQLQKDDARWGIAIAKVSWISEHETAEPPKTEAADREALEVERAWEENRDPARARVSEDDLDYVHAEIHGELLARLGDDDPAAWPLHEHNQQHEDRQTVITTEYPKLERVPPYRFVYDTDVPWPERGWEVEEKSERIAELLRQGYRNVNPLNCPPEVKEGEVAAPYEDLTTRIFDIHDRRNGRHYVIPALGAEDGLFLQKEDWQYEDVEMYVLVVFRPAEPEQTHGESTVQRCIPICERLGTVDFYIDRHIAEHSNYRVGGPKVANDEGFKAAFNDPDRKHLFEGPPELWALMKEIKPPPLPPQLIEVRSMLLGELRRETGADAQDTGAPNPHQISATESAKRGVSREERKTTRQEVMADFLGEVGETFLALRRKFGTLGIRVRVVGAQQTEYPTVNPEQLPKEVDIFFDVRGETDEAKQERIIAATAAKDYLMAIGLAYPTDWSLFSEWFLRQLGINRPEQFRTDEAEVVEPGQQQGSPGVPNTPGEQAIQFPGGQQAPEQENFAPQQDRLLG